MKTLFPSKVILGTDTSSFLDRVQLRGLKLLFASYTWSWLLEDPLATCQERRRRLFSPRPIWASGTIGQRSQGTKSHRHQLKPKCIRILNFSFASTQFITRWKSWWRQHEGHVRLPIRPSVLMTKMIHSEPHFVSQQLARRYFLLTAHFIHFVSGDIQMPSTQRVTFITPENKINCCPWFIHETYSYS